MGKFTKVSKIAMAAAVGSAAVVVPVATQAAETELTPAKVAFNVDGEVKIITADEYIAAVMGLEPTILAAITNAAGEVVAPETVNIGGKYISSEAYVLAYMSGDVVTQEEIDAAESVSVDGAKELVDGEWVDVETDPIEGEITVESVSAINTTTVEVTFNNELEELDKAAVTVVNKATNAKQYVKAVKVDGNKATVELYEALTSGQTYTVTVGEAGSKELAFAVGVPTKIEVETTQVAAAGAPYAVKYKVLDETGLDITSTTKVKVEADKAVTDNKLDAQTAGATAFVYVTALDKDGKAIAATKSQRVTVKFEDAKTAEILDVSTTNDFTSTSYKQDLTVRLGEAAKTLNVFVANQFGTKSVLNLGTTTETVKFESLDRSIAIVDVNTGKITPVKEGTVAVKVTVGTVSKTVEVKVEAATSITSLKVDKSEISISDKLSAGQKVEVTVLDQYEKAVTTETGDLKAEVKTGKDIISLDTAKVTLTNTGKAVFTVIPTAGEEGTATIEFTYTKAGKNYTATTTVNVTKAGLIEEYVVEGFETELDLYAGAEGKNTTSMDLAVFGVDANGTKVGNALTSGAYTVKVTDSEGAEVTTDLDTLTDAELKADETYTVEILVGTLSVFKEKFTVVDTTPAAAKPGIEFTASSIKDANFDGELIDELLAEMDITGDAFKAAKPAAKIAKVTYISDASSVVESGTDASAITLKDDKGTANLSIQKVTIDLDGDLSGTTDDTVDVEFVTPEVITVKSAITTPTKVDSLTLAGFTLEKNEIGNANGLSGLKSTYANGKLTVTGTATAAQLDAILETDKAAFTTYWNAPATATKFEVVQADANGDFSTSSLTAFDGVLEWGAVDGTKKYVKVSQYFAKKDAGTWAITNKEDNSTFKGETTYRIYFEDADGVIAIQELAIDFTGVTVTLPTAP